MEISSKYSIVKNMMKCAQKKKKKKEPKIEKISVEIFVAETILGNVYRNIRKKKKKKKRIQANVCHCIV